MLFDVHCIDMTQSKKSCTANHIYYISKYREIRSLCPQHSRIFTDDLKQNNHHTVTAVLNSQTITKTLPNSASRYTIGLCAILLKSVNNYNKYYTFFSY